MIKFAECPDLHRSPEWATVSTMIENAIIHAAETHAVDFVALVGDYHDKPTYASEKGGIKEEIDFIKRLSSICPVVAIEGTPSHDAPGSYSHLEEVGLVLLQPGKMYGYGDFKTMTNRVRELDVNKGWDGSPSCIIFGIPEPAKSWAQANDATLSADEINARVVELVGQLIDEEIAPRRAMFPNIPAIGLFHGNVSDAHDRECETDEILKKSDIVIKAETFSRANLSRWSFGHLHNKHEMKNVCGGYAGYAGMDKNPWAPGKLGFFPSMNIVTIDDDLKVSIEAESYGTPMRLKITEPLPTYRNDTAYWIVSSDPLAIDPALSGGHSWSRKTDAESISETSRRVDAETMGTAESLTDLAKLYDPEITPSVTLKLAEIERTIPRPVTIERDVRVLDVTVTGAKFWNGETVSVNIKDLQNGLTQLAGENGSGKSSLAGFCTPYPLFVGKETDSGRSSAIKDFFQESESGIKKTILFNGETHEHLITIRGAHTQNPKTECYLSVSGIPQLEKATFDDMMTKCEELYGKFDDYLLTSFYVQPLQGKAESGLMTANMTTVRDLVQNIAGIDHRSEKEYALSKIREIENATVRESLQIDADENAIPDKDQTSADHYNLIVDRDTLIVLKPVKESIISTAELAYNSRKLEADRETERAERKARLLTDARTINGEITAHETRSTELTSLIEFAPMYRSTLEGDALIKATYATARIELAEIEKLNAIGRLAEQTSSARVREIDAEIARLKTADETAHNISTGKYREVVAARNNAIAINKANEEKIALLNKPCEHCGKLSSTVEVAIAEINSRMMPIPEDPVMPGDIVYTVPSAELTTERAMLASRAPFTAETMTMPDHGLTDSDIADYRKKVEDSARAESELSIIKNELIPGKKARANAAIIEADAITLVPVDMTVVTTTLDNARKELSELTSSIARIEANIETKRQVLATIETKKQEIANRREAMKGAISDLEEWRRIDVMLSPSKLPAFELDVMLDSIDAEATRHVAPYRAGRYFFKTVTQKEGKKDTIDKFDILIHDCIDGRERSFLKYSVGEKSFFNSAYCQALTRMRKQNSKTSYTPVILDEADSFIDQKNITEYYEMVKDVYAETKALVVTHSPETGAYIQNHIYMEELHA